jgi:cytochrome bd ubiquinol oxidase subunit II
MLMALIFRGIAFELRFKAAPSARHRWDAAFHYGSLVATLAQGFVLGAFVQGFRAERRMFACGSFDWLSVFSVLTAVSLVAGYGLLGATWPIMKTDGIVQDWARREARRLLVVLMLAMGAVGLWTPFLEPKMMQRWFSWPNIALASPLPVVTAWLALALWRAIDRRSEFLPFIGAVALFTMGYVGLAISLCTNIVPHAISLWDAAASPRSQAFLLVGTLVLLPVIAGYTAWSYWVFRGKVRAEPGYH